MGAEQHLHLRRAQGKVLIDVPLAVAHHGDCRGTGGEQGRGGLGGGQPAVALLPGERALVAMHRRGAAVAGEEGRLDQPQQRPGRRIHRDGGVQVQAVAVAVIAQRGGVLDRQDVPAGRQTEMGDMGGMRRDSEIASAASQRAMESRKEGDV